MTLIKKNIENPATGEIIEVKTHVDDKYTDQELLNIALENDMFSIIHTPELTTTPKPEPTWAKQFTNFTKENLDIPGGLVGAAVGTRGGPAGMIIGGAVGTFAGVIGSDYLTEEDIDYVNAMEEAAFSVGIDLVTLGTGKV